MRHVYKCVDYFQKRPTIVVTVQVTVKMVELAPG